MILSKHTIIILIFLFFFTPGFAATKISVIEPRQYGYVLGDIFERMLIVKNEKKINIPLNKKKLLGRINNWFSIRDIQTQKNSNNELTVLVEYQIINVPNKPMMVVVPNFKLNVEEGVKKSELIAPELLITLAPITPVIISNRDGLQNIQPQKKIQNVSSKNINSNIIIWISSLIIPFSILFYLWAPWQLLFPQKKLPFSHALSKIKTIQHLSDEKFWRDSLFLFHRALNTSANRTVFIHSVDNFVDQNSKYKIHANQIKFFLKCSREFFFEEKSFPDEDEKTRFLLFMNQMALAEKRLE